MVYLVTQEKSNFQRYESALSTIAYPFLPAGPGLFTAEMDAVCT